MGFQGWKKPMLYPSVLMHSYVALLASIIGLWLLLAKQWLPMLPWSGCTGSDLLFHPVFFYSTSAIHLLTNSYIYVNTD
jgi:hypothetical protein